MKQRTLKKLKRGELVEILIHLEEENRTLKEHIQSLETEVGERNIIIGEAGSLAEACVGLTKIFEHAQETADLYLEQIARRVKTEKGIKKGKNVKRANGKLEERADG